jgi:small subunit ribosomal protein S8e
MAISQQKSKRKSTGGRFRAIRKKKLYELGREPALTKLGENKISEGRTTGGTIKHWTLATNVINLVDPKTKKAVKATIKTVTENPANRQYIRRNILTKGTIVETDKGKAKITSRPGQEGALNGVLI